MEMFALLMGAANMKVDWSYALITNGEQSATVDGLLLMLQQYANSLDILIVEVSNGYVDTVH